MATRGKKTSVRRCVELLYGDAIIDILSTLLLLLLLLLCLYRKSFPSMHAAVSAFSAFYVAVSS